MHIRRHVDNTETKNGKAYFCTFNFLSLSLIKNYTEIPDLN